MNRHEQRPKTSLLDIAKLSVAVIGSAAVLAYIGAAIYTAEQMAYGSPESSGNTVPSYTSQGVGQMGASYYRGIERTLEHLVGIHSS